MMKPTPVVCKICDQDVTGEGPWCELYLGERGGWCIPLLREKLDRAERNGDQEMAAAVRHYAQQKHNITL